MLTADCSERGSNWWLVTARASGQGLTVCLSSLLLTMCRPLLTLLRRLGVHRFLPLDLHVSYHKTCGVLLALLGLLHTVCHLVNLEVHLVPDPLNNPANYSLTQWLLSSDTTNWGTIPGQQQPRNS